MRIPKSVFAVVAGLGLGLAIAPGAAIASEAPAGGAPAEQAVASQARGAAASQDQGAKASVSQTQGTASVASQVAAASSTQAGSQNQASQAQRQPAGSQEAQTQAQAQQPEPTYAVADGTYVVATGTGGRGVLDVSGASKKSAANVQQYSSNMTGAQIWRVTHDSKGIVLTDEGSGKVLDVYGGSRRSGTNVQQYQSNGTLAQRWIPRALSGGGFELRSALGDNLVLDVSSGSRANGANVQVWTSNGSAAQRFFFYDARPNVAAGEDLGLGSGDYSIRAASSTEGAVLDVSGASHANGANVQQYSANGSFAQGFKLVKHGGYYQVVSDESGKALSVSGSSVLPGTNIHQWDANPSDRNTLFAASRNSDGSVSFRSVSTGMMLSISGGSNRSGANLEIWKPNGSGAQRFFLTRLTSILSQGLYELAPASASSKRLDVSDGSTAEGANVQQWAANGTLAQKWQLVRSGGDNTYGLRSVVSGHWLTADASGNVSQRASLSDSSRWLASVSGGMVTLRNTGSGNVLDIAGASRANGGNVQTYTSNGTAAQRFKLYSTAPIANGLYVLNLGGGNALDVAGASMGDGAYVQSYRSNGTGAQKWRLTRNGDGTYSVVNAHSGKALDISNGRIAEGNNVWQYASNGSKTQRWRLDYDGGAGTFKLVYAANPSYAIKLSGSNIVIGEGNSAKFSFTATTDELTAAQRRILNACRTTPSPGAGWCAAWVSNVFQRAGFRRPGGNACDMYRAWCHSNNLADLKVGMIIAVDTHPHTRAGSIYGHVGIYIGDGKIMQNVGKITTDTVSHWVSWYGVLGNARWGWVDNRHLA